MLKHCGYDDEEYAYVANQTFAVEALQKILYEHVTVNHSEYAHCCRLIKKYSRHGTIECLLTLYTLETPFYHYLCIFQIYNIGIIKVDLIVVLI